MKLFICDSCEAQFEAPLDEVQYKNENGIFETYDMCAPCRKKLADDKTKGEKAFFDKIKKGK